MLVVDDMFKRNLMGKHKNVSNGKWMQITDVYHQNTYKYQDDDKDQNDDDSHNNVDDDGDDKDDH